MRVAAFIPAFRCAPQIRRVIAEIPPDLFNHIDTFFIVDNASPDGTAAAAAQAIAASAASGQFRLLQNPVNLGLGGSFKKTLTLARQEGFTHVLMMHGDDQATWQDVPKLIEAAKKNPSTSAILGSRFSTRRKPLAYSLRRWLANLFFNAVMSLVLGRRIEDIGSGLNFYFLKDFTDDVLQELPDHVAFDLHLLFALHDRRRSFVFVPIQWRTKDQQSTIHELSLGWLLLKEIFLYVVRGQSAGKRHGS